MILKLLQIKEEHLEVIRSWRMSEDVSKYLYTDPNITPQDQLRWYQQIIQDATRMDWIVEVDGKNTGVVGLYDINPHNSRCFWAYYLGKQGVRGQGVGRAIELNILQYVFQQLHLHKLCCEVLQSNDLVVKIHEKYGSKIEGLFREHIWKRYEYHNVIRMGILQREWQQNIKNKFEYEAAMIEEWEDKRDRLLASLRD